MKSQEAGLNAGIVGILVFMMATPILAHLGQNALGCVSMGFALYCGLYVRNTNDELIEKESNRGPNV